MYKISARYEGHRKWLKIFETADDAMKISRIENYEGRWRSRSIQV